MSHQTRSVGDLHLATVVVNVQDIPRAVRFWSSALGYQQRDAAPAPHFVTLVDPAGRRVPLSLQLAENDSAGPVRVHVDLYTSRQSDEVERLVALGASRVDDWRYPEDPDFVVLRDPDGNEFCVIDQAEL